MTNYKIILLATALLITGLAKADKNKGTRSVPFTQGHRTTTVGSCPITTAQVDLDINNVRARILNGGDLWWDPVSQTPYYEVPIGQGKSSLYSGAIWIGGYDASNALRVAAQTYRQQGANDFWSGPISKDPATGLASVSEATCSKYDRFWIITKAEVEAFAAGGTATQAIKEWPGNGNYLAGTERQDLAPFFDANGDGVYDYSAGDYPGYLIAGDYAFDPITHTKPICNDYLFGDKTLWWVFNDVGNNHSETFSVDPIGLEVRAQAFEFKTADAINDMTFYKYQIINRSSDALYNTYMGQWADPDLGNAADDYVGCDVGLGLGFVYNSDPDDEGAGGYGTNPPSLGIDFFQGPLADVGDSVDNDRDGCLDCTFITDKNTGVTTTYPDTVLQEQIIMSNFIFYQNDFTDIGNPQAVDDYYEYLSGFWKDGTPVTYGGTGKGGADPTPFMFPGTTDPNGGAPWTMVDYGPGQDVRFIQSAGKFTLQPGAENFITTGVVWARTASGGPDASVTLVKLADKKAQALFDNCFKVLDGPDAPDLAIRELDKELIINFDNTKQVKVERYLQLDPTIPQQVPDTGGLFVNLSDEERSYKFEGYKLYQLKDKGVSANELADPGKAKLIMQEDLQNNIRIIINFEFDNALNVWTPVKKTEDINAGLVHTFDLKQDYFTGQPLINYKPYYYMAISYAYNSFRPFDQLNASFTQYRPYVQGRNNVKVYSGIPHKPLLNNGGTILNATTGQQGVAIKRVEGQGNGGNVLDLSQASADSALIAPNFRTVYPVYEAAHGPVKVGIYDPFKAKSGDLTLSFNGVADTASWYLLNQHNLSDTIDSSAFSLGVLTQELVPSRGLTLDVTKVYGPGSSSEFVVNNGFLEATKTYADPSKSWLSGVKDNDAAGVQDWIRSAGVGAQYGDANKVFQSVLGGTWAPYILTSDAKIGGPKFDNPRMHPSPTVPNAPDNIIWSTLNSVDLVITQDKSKWTRAIVFQEYDSSAIALKKFNKRYVPSVDKNGLASGGDTIDPNSSNFIDSVGMSWFPGYAINVETGERLNIGFGEDSLSVNDNGTDMMWNPTSRLNGQGITGDSGRVVFGGKHYIYIFNKYFADSAVALSSGGQSRIPAYDYCWRIDSLIKNVSNFNKVRVFKSCIWTSLPLLTDASAKYQFLPSSSGKLNIPPTDVKIRLRVTKPYENYVSANTPALNAGNPYYEFGLKGIDPTFNVESVAKSALDNVSVVPNPYYAYSSYEKTKEDQLDSRIRFINLPSHCIVSIYTSNGTLIRQLKRDVQADVSDGQAVEEGQDSNLSSTLDWDLKNTAGIPIASGIYIIHIDAGSLGEKVIKWFGVMRPLDLDTF